MGKGKISPLQRGNQSWFLACGGEKMLKLIRGTVVVKSLDQQRYYKLSITMTALPSEAHGPIVGWTIWEVAEPRMMRKIGEPFATFLTIFPVIEEVEKAIADYERTH